MRVFGEAWLDRYVPLVGLIAGFAIYATTLGVDADWDLKNYHIYNAYALMHGRLGQDLAPAQLQTWLVPWLDVPMQVLRTWLNRHPIGAAAVFSLPHGIAAYLTYRIARELLPAASPLAWFVALLMAVIGATAAGAFSTLASAMTDTEPACLVLAAVLVLLRALRQPGLGKCFAAGFMLGLAGGLKLTTITYGAAAWIGFLVATPAKTRFRLSGISALGYVLGMVICAGPWWMVLWNAFGNPFFPFFNAIFHSPWYVPVNITDARFMPRSFLEAIFYPFYWAGTPMALVSELKLSDARLAMVWCILVGSFAGVFVALARGASWRRLDPPALFLMLFLALSYVAWEIEFSILRYADVIEFLCGVAWLIPLRLLPRVWPGRQSWAAAVSVLAMVGFASSTTYPDWGHAAAADRLLAARLPTLDRDAMLVILDDSPVAYIAYFLPDSVRMVGANSNLVIPRPPIDRMEQAVQLAIATHKGPLWGLEDPVDSPGSADRALAFYGLRRDSCSNIWTNLDASSLRLCRLSRAAHAAPQ